MTGVCVFGQESIALSEKTAESCGEVVPGPLNTSMCCTPLSTQGHLLPVLGHRGKNGSGGETIL